MLTWAERRERWQLRRELARIDRDRRRRDPVLTAEQWHSQAAEYFSERELVDYKLWEIESNALRRCAERLAIDDPGECDEGGGYYFLPLDARNALRRAVRHEHRETAKFWASMLLPLLSLLVALAAVLSD